MRLSLLVLLIMVRTAAADPCAGVAAPLRSVAVELHRLTRHASEAVLACRFGGPDAQLAATLHAEATRAAKDEQAVASFGGCILNPTGQTPVSLVSSLDDWTGERLTAALALCAPKPGAPSAIPGPAADCATTAQQSRAVVQQMEDAAARGIELAAACATKGVNDAGLAELARNSKPKIVGAIRALPAHVACTGSPLSLQGLLEGEAKSAGIRLGVAYAMCSSKARAVETKLARAGTTSPADLTQALGPLTGAYAEQVFGE